MNITATQINLYHVCKRELWLHANGMTMEHSSDIVYEGKLLHETVYPQRSERYEELEIGGCKIDFFDAKNKVVHEIKKSDKVDTAHEWQVKYYIYILEQNGINGVTGILEYPALRKTDKVILSETDHIRIKEILKDIQEIVESRSMPNMY